MVCGIVMPLQAATAAEQLAGGRSALQRGEAEKAVDLFSKAVAAQPNDATAHYLLGVAYREQAMQASMFERASLAQKVKPELERAVELDPNHIDARFALVTYYLLAPAFMGGGADKAQAQAAEIKRRNPVEGHRAYANIYAQDKKHDLVRKEFVDAVRENPTSARAHYLLGTYLMSETEKNWTGSLQELEAAAKLDPAYMPTYVRIGQHSLKSGSNYVRGEESLRKYLGYKPTESEPKLSSAWYSLGQLQQKQGKNADAKQSYLNALKVAPNDKDATEALKKL
jgi:Tfp pilus assembly protein PilF